MLRQPSFPSRRQPAHTALRLAFVCAAPLVLGGCLDQIANLNCKKVKSDLVHVGRDASCRFRYGGGDVAKYVVMVTRQPSYGEAQGDGKYLKYVAKRGFVGEDRVGIRVVRRGVGHVQWENLTVTVKVGPNA
jgi:hypothetical protein